MEFEIQYQINSMTKQLVLGKSQSISKLWLKYKPAPNGSQLPSIVHKIYH